MDATFEKNASPYTARSFLSAVPLRICNFRAGRVWGRRKQYGNGTKDSRTEGSICGRHRGGGERVFRAWLRSEFRNKSSSGSRKTACSLGLRGFDLAAGSCIGAGSVSVSSPGKPPHGTHVSQDDRVPSVDFFSEEMVAVVTATHSSSVSEFLTAQEISTCVSLSSCFGNLWFCMCTSAEA